MSVYEMRQAWRLDVGDVILVTPELQARHRKPGALDGASRLTVRTFEHTMFHNVKLTFHTGEAVTVKPYFEVKVEV